VTRRRTILLHGLDEETERQLRSALLHSGMSVEAEACEARALMDGVDAVFTTSMAALARTTGAEGKAPVVVVSRLEEAEQYLLAMESGAHDYCVVPFEPSQLRWILTTAAMKENLCVQAESD